MTYQSSHVKSKRASGVSFRIATIASSFATASSKVAPRTLNSFLLSPHKLNK